MYPPRDELTRRTVVRAIPACLLLLLALWRAAGPASAEAIPPPDVTADAVFSIDIDAGVELYAKEPDRELPPASTTKIATAILLVRAKGDQLDRSVQIEADDLATEGESTMALQAGDEVTFGDLLNGLLLPSGNDAARAVARVVGGEMAGDGEPGERFVAAMNALAAELGMQHTRFLNPTGLHEDGHYSSARDMATLATEAFSNRLIRDVIKSGSYDVTYGGPNPRQATIETTVDLFGEPGIIGGKTGTTPEAGACLVLLSREKSANRVVTVLLGSEIEFDGGQVQMPETDRRFADAAALLKQLDRDYRWVDPTKADEVPGLQEEMTAWDVTLRADDAIVVPQRDEPVRYQLVLGPEGEPESEVGHVLFFVGSEQVADRPVVQSAAEGQAARGDEQTIDRRAAPLPRASPTHLAAGATRSMERLQRVLAARGVSSRRGAEEMIRQGRVSVNGKLVTELGTKVDPDPRPDSSRRPDAQASASALSAALQTARRHHHRQRRTRPPHRHGSDHRAGARLPRRPARPRHRGPAALDQRRRRRQPRHAPALRTRQGVPRPHPGAADADDVAAHPRRHRRRRPPGGSRARSASSARRTRD